MAYQQSQNNNTQDKPIYNRTKCATIYNNKTGALQLSYASAGFGKAFAQMSFAAVFNDMRGKNPKKGEQTYDYDNGIFISLSAEDVRVLRHVINAYKAKRIIDMEINFRGSVFRLIDASASGEEDMTDGVIIYVGKSEDSKKAADYTHSFYFENIHLQGYNSGDKDAQPVEEVCNPTFETFSDWVDELSRCLVSPMDHKPNRGEAASYNQNTSGTSTPRAPSRRTAQAWANSGNNTQAEAPAENYDQNSDDLPF